jgi:carboxymethylenebutenolidase
MCDEHTVHDDEIFLSKTGDLSRRGFGVMSMAALAACATSPADAKEVVEQDVKITTPDGVCDAYFVHPAKGKHAAVIVWPDILGLRPGFRVMGKRLAESGYAVLTVNPFYRKEASPVVPEGASFTDPAIRGKVVPLMQSLTPDTQKTDAIAFVKWLDGQAAVDAKKKIGTTGYCMGGPIVMRTAAAVPDRIGGAATFHGGGLATANANSPHLLIPQMKADFLICVAQNDDQSDPKAKDTLKESFAAAKLPAEIEVYPAQHGWCAIDSAVFDQVQADRAWARLLATFGTALA